MLKTFIVYYKLSERFWVSHAVVVAEDEEAAKKYVSAKLSSTVTDDFDIVLAKELPQAEGFVLI